MAKIEADTMRDQFVVTGTYGTPTTRTFSGGYEFVITHEDVYRALSNTPFRGFSIRGPAPQKRTKPSYRQRQAAGRAARQRKGQA
jgi:hypothetical protein